jgi:hypothetical protein
MRADYIYIQIAVMEQRVVGFLLNIFCSCCVSGYIGNLCSFISPYGSFLEFRVVYIFESGSLIPVQLW